MIEDLVQEQRNKKTQEEKTALEESKHSELTNAIHRVEFAIDSIPKDIEVNNLDEVKAHLRNELRLVIKAIERIKIPDAIKVVNFPKPEKVNINIPDTVKISNLADLKQFFSDLSAKIEAIQVNPQVNVNVPDVVVPEIKAPNVIVPAPQVTVNPAVDIDISPILKALDPLKFISDRPAKPISVRLSDGKAFLKAMKEVTDATQKTMYAFASSNGLTVDEFRSTIRAGDDILSGYKCADVDADASPNYYGFIDKDGNWYILKEVVSAGADTYRYAKGSSGYTTNWTNRASSVVYDYFDVVF